MGAPKPKLDSDMIYSAPAPKAVDAFARRVCQRLGADYTKREVVEGFAAFIKVATQIQVKHLNKQQGSCESE